MSQDSPTISVIIPTHNRQASLKRLLESLEGQTYLLEQMEVIVIADGCNDTTVEMLKSYHGPLALRFSDQPGKGAAIARNQGAAIAKGSLLLFLDDDIDPTSHLVEVHVHAHRQPNQVVIGYLPPLLSNPPSFFHIQLRAWWEEKFQAMHKPGHRYTFEDLLSGNFSLDAELFNRVGGFDTAFRFHEDYELGVRLLEAGADFMIEMNACGQHRDEAADLDRSLRRKRDEGAADVLFGRRHPEVMHRLGLFRFGQPNSRLEQVKVRIIFRFQGLCDILVGTLRWSLDVMEALRMRGYWQRLNNRVHAYWYLRGVVDELKTHKTLLNYLQGGLMRPDESMHEIEVDLEQGLANAEQQLDNERPGSVRIRYGQHTLGRIPPQAGAERLRGTHLRAILATDLAWPLIIALALEGAIDPALFSERLSQK